MSSVIAVKFTKMNFLIILFKIRLFSLCYPLVTQVFCKIFLILPVVILYHICFFDPVWCMVLYCYILNLCLYFLTKPCVPNGKHDCCYF